jgi:hypothetical protein
MEKKNALEIGSTFELFCFVFFFFFTIQFSLLGGGRFRDTSFGTSVVTVLSFDTVGSFDIFRVVLLGVVFPTLGFVAFANNDVDADQLRIDLGVDVTKLFSSSMDALSK